MTRSQLKNLKKYTPILVVLTLLVCKEGASGYSRDRVTNRKPTGLASHAAPTSEVDVWNNVIDVDRLASLLHDESHRIGLGHKVFSRSPSTTFSNDSKNVIEKTLDSILTELKDDSKYVEYWTRLEWRSIQAHADVDEYKAKQDTKSDEMKNTGYRYPRNGHVLYLKVGTQVRGPTCVFPNRKSGGDLLRKIETVMAFEGDGKICADGGLNSEKLEDDKLLDEKEDDYVELVTVPAVPGRLLRFRGDYLHAVPRPTDLWLLKFVQGSPSFEPEEDWGRSVILFNTWDDEPPLGLPVDEGNDEDYISNHNYHFQSKQYSCNNISQWSPANYSPLNESQDELQAENLICQQKEETIPAKIWLLGDYRRRDYERQTVKLEATESLREALYQESSVMSTRLRIPL